MYDIIGDIHGYADKLEALLVKMGYVARGDGYVAPVARQAVFVGDLIDRGPAQRRVLQVVRAMVDSGDALAVLGNHEFNAIGFATRRDDAIGDFLRPRSAKNHAQHNRFLAEVGLDSDDHRQWVEWFKTLPLFLDLGGIRVVHGWWDADAVAAVEGAYWNSRRSAMSDEFLQASYGNATALQSARKLLTCGVEWDLPNGQCIVDKEGHRHGEARLAVWRHWAENLRAIALVPKGSEDSVPDIAVPAEFRIGEVTGAPILFGHHWFAGDPKLETPKVACLDWSAAKEGPLVAYRWDGEAELRDDQLTWVGAECRG